MDVFRTIRVRGTWRIGRRLVANDPRTFLQGALAVAEKILLQSGLISHPVLKSAPYAIASPLTRKDQLFVAQHVAPLGDALIADYCFLTEAIPYALRPDAKSAVIMHDLFSSRARQFAALGAADSAVTLTEEEECALLAKADAIVAIQKDEAELLRARIPQRKIIVAPMAILPVEAPQPGRGDRILFIGSSAAANVDGLKWFLGSCWPRIRRRQGAMVLRVGGTVCDKIGTPPAGVEFLGVVNDLTPLYAEAGLVFSPLRAGSGLKIKLIEALGHGKAVVATSVTMQGVADILRDCVCVADDPESFVSAILELSVDAPARNALAARGLAAISKYFSPEACYGEFIEAIM
jgi:succinoglycan biosynthesis protein ExoO